MLAGAIFFCSGQNLAYAMVYLIFTGIVSVRLDLFVYDNNMKINLLMPFAILSYRLTNWLMFLCRQIQSPRPDVMPDRRQGIARAEGFVAACIETSVS